MFWCGKAAYLWGSRCPSFADCSHTAPSLALPPDRLCPMMCIVRGLVLISDLVSITDREKQFSSKVMCVHVVPLDQAGFHAPQHTLAEKQDLCRWHWFPGEIIILRGVLYSRYWLWHKCLLFFWAVKEHIFCGIYVKCITHAVRCTK